jgi:hypothetical protein
MSDADYLIERAHQELNAAMRTSDPRVRNVHLELADAYTFRLRELKRQEQRSALPCLSFSAPQAAGLSIAEIDHSSRPATLLELREDKRPTSGRSVSAGRRRRLGAR